MIATVLDILKDKIPIGLYYKVLKSDNPNKTINKFLTTKEIKTLNQIIKNRNINYSFTIIEDDIKTNTEKTNNTSKMGVYYIKKKTSQPQQQEKTKQSEQISKNKIVNKVSNINQKIEQSDDDILFGSDTR